MLNQPVVGGGGGGLTTAQVQALIDASNLWQNVGARVRKSADEEIANNNVEKLVWDIEDYDNGGLFDAVADNTGFVIVTAGYYWTWARVTWEANAANTRLLMIYKDDTQLARDRIEGVELAGNQTEHGVFYEDYFDVGEVINVRVFQNSGGALDIQYFANISPVFGIRLVAPPG